MGYESQQQYAKSIFDEHPEVKGELIVSDPRFYQRQNALFRDWTQNRKDWKATFSNWLAGFNAQTPTITENVNKKNTFIDWLRGGGFRDQNAELRAKEREADQLGLKNALDFAAAGTGAAKIYGGGNVGTSSSADRASRLRIGGRATADFAARDVARQRADLGSEINIRLATERRINENLEKLNNRILQPQQLSDMELGQLIQYLNSLGAGTQFGAQPHFWDVSNDYDKVGAGFALAGNAYTSYATQGQGGPSQDKTSPTVTGSPSGSSNVGSGGYFGTTTQSGYPNQVSYGSGSYPAANYGANTGGYYQPQSGSWMSYGGGYY